MKKKYISHLNNLIKNHLFLLQTLELQINMLIKNIKTIQNFSKSC